MDSSCGSTSSAAAHAADDDNAACPCASLKIFKCTVNSAAALLDFMPDADLLEAMRAAALLQSRVLKVMSPVFAQLPRSAAAADRRSCRDSSVGPAGNTDCHDVTQEAVTAAAARPIDGDDEAGPFVSGLGEEEEDAVALETEIIRSSSEREVIAAANRPPSPHQTNGDAEEAAEVATEPVVKRIKLESVGDVCSAQDSSDPTTAVDCVIVDPEDGGFIIPGFTILGSDAMAADAETAASTTAGGDSRRCRRPDRNQQEIPAPYALLSSISQAKLLSALTRAVRDGRTKSA